MKNQINAIELRNLAEKCAKLNLQQIIKQQDNVIVRHILRKAKALSKLQVFEVTIDKMSIGVKQQLIELGFKVKSTKKGLFGTVMVVVSWYQD